jgi:hypothetical protein
MLGAMMPDVVVRVVTRMVLMRRLGERGIGQKHCHAGRD